ncbi:MAG TPA: hypothetical protein VNP89_01530 [Gaiellaceae bacterium]|nr:hypothetical protein [Gaiellaceae bacterium]
MSPEFRKVALIAAALGLLVSLFFALRPDDDDDDAAATTATQTVTTAPTTTEVPPPTTTEQVTTTAPPPQPTVVRARIVVPGDTAPTVKRFSVQRDRQVVLVVESALTDHVHLHGYDLMADVAPGAPATIRFKANAPGRFEIELEDRGLEIGELEVRP